ncbi:MAG: hypothetical protein E6Q34_09550 [Burkholderiaceae bacterium]|nr:MAG: hypothetical protein E6Q34_09550 [Burkholderiaceae bacterium]
MKRYLVCTFALACLTAGLPSRSAAHDLEANRASVVLRDNSHLSLSLRIDYVRFLQQSFAPKATQAQALLELASMSERDFEAVYQKAQRVLMEQTILTIGTAKTLQLNHWRHPKAQQIQQSIRELSAQLIVAPSEHIHSEFFEVLADTYNTEDISECSLKLPSSLGNVLVVHYRAQQQWNEQTAVKLKF